MEGVRCGAVLRRRARNSERGRAPLGLANEANEEEPACETRSTHPRSPPSPCPRAKAAAEVICQGVFTILSCQDFRNPKSSIQGAPLIEARGTVVAAKYERCHLAEASSTKWLRWSFPFSIKLEPSSI